MPIRFRCPQCDRMLGIARRKAGSQTECPGCGKVVTVPVQDDRNELDELDLLLNPNPVANGGLPHKPKPEPARPAPPVAVAPRPVPAPPRKPQSPDERPLFERDVDSMLGIPKPAAEVLPLDDDPKAKPVSGMDALSLGADTSKLVLSPQKATFLAVAVVVLLAVAFAAGYMLAGK